MFSNSFVAHSRQARSSLNFNWVNRGGRIDIGGSKLVVRMEGFFKGRWVLEHPAHGVIASAEPDGWFGSNFLVRDGNGVLFMQRRLTFFTMEYTLERRSTVSGQLESKGLFGREILLTSRDERLTLATALFCAYIAIAWRRQQSN